MAATQMVRDSGLDAVIGMYPVVHRLRTTVVDPWMAAATGDPQVRAPRRVLVHGVPGSGVRFVARQLVEELDARAGVGAVVLESFDDDVVRDPSETMALLSSPQVSDVVVVGVSHRPWDLPREFMGERGFERLAFVSPPDWDARRFRLWETPLGCRLAAEELDSIVVATEGWAGTDLAHLGSSAPGVEEALASIADVNRTGTEASAWLGRSRALVHAMDAYGRIDDLVGYLQRYRLL